MKEREIEFRLRIGKEIVGYEKWTPEGWHYKPTDGAWTYIYIYHTDKDQFTGLCDRNKKEGYHKDICELGGFYLLDDPRIARCIIEWDKGAFYLQPIGTDQHWSIQLLDGAEIIGDVFQRKDLLEEKP